MELKPFSDSSIADLIANPDRARDFFIRGVDLRDGVNPGVWYIYPRPRGVLYDGPIPQWGDSEMEILIKLARLHAVHRDYVFGTQTKGVHTGYLDPIIFRELKKMVFDPVAFLTAAVSASKWEALRVREAAFFGGYPSKTKWGDFVIYPDSKLFPSPNGQFAKTRPLGYKPPVDHGLNFLLDKVIPKWNV